MLDRTFEVSIALKGVDGALEIVGGIVLFFVAPATLQHWARTLTAHELAQDMRSVLCLASTEATHATSVFATGSRA